MRALWKVVLPTVWPGLTTVGLLVGLASWGEYFGALILTGPHTETAPVAVEGYIGTTFANWSNLAAAGVVLVVPALLATIVVQRGFVRGASHVAAQHARVRVIQDRGFDTPAEQLVGLPHEELVEAVLGRDQHGEPAAASPGAAPLLPERSDGPREADRDHTVE
jgi:hypothetical protein